MNVLITSVGTTTSIGVIKALRMQSQLDVVLFGIDTNPEELCAGASLVDCYSKFPTSLEKPGYEDRLLNFVLEHNIDCVIPIHDRELEVVSELSKSVSHPCFWAVNSPEVIRQCNNKVSASKIAESIGIKVPKIFFSLDEVDTYPIIAKPLFGVGSNGQYLIENIDDLISFSKKVQLGSYILQEYILGEEFTVDCYSGYYSEFFSCLPRLRIQVKSGIVTKSRTCKNEQLYEYCHKLNAVMGLRGATNIQFIYSNHCYYFLEINPRFSGGGILSYTAGFHSPLWTLQEASGKYVTNSVEKEYTYELIMTRYWTEVFHKRNDRIII